MHRNIVAGFVLLFERKRRVFIVRGLLLENSTLVLKMTMACLRVLTRSNSSGATVDISSKAVK